MVHKYRTSHNSGFTFDDGEVEHLLKEAVAKRGITLAEYFAEAIEQQLARNGVSSPDGNGDGNREQHSQSQSLLKSTRDSIEIIRDILVLGEVTKTRIKYEVGLDHRQAERYLNFLIKGEFSEKVEINSRGTIYRPSRQGLQLLQRIDGLYKVLNSTTRD